MRPPETACCALLFRPILDATSGRRLASVPIDGDADDLFVDARTRRLYVSCGAGFIDIVAVPVSGPPRALGRIPTAPGARTSLFDAAQGRLFLAVPHRGARVAEVRVFEVARQPSGYRMAVPRREVSSHERPAQTIPASDPAPPRRRAA